MGNGKEEFMNPFFPFFTVGNQGFDCVRKTRRIGGQHFLSYL